MSTEKKKENVEPKPEEVKEEKEQMEETPAPATQEKTVFGKIDDKIMAKKAAKAEKKDAKAKAKAAKAAEGKKWDWKRTLGVVAGVVGTVGTVTAIIQANQIAAMEEENRKNCEAQKPAELPAAQTEPNQAPVQQTETKVQEVTPEN